MSFIATTLERPEIETEITSEEFYPKIDPVKFRSTQRSDGTITPERLRTALIESIATVNIELSAWRTARVLEGYDTLESVPTEHIDGKSINVHRYERAVYCLAKSNLLERYRDYDSSNSGNKRAEEFDASIDDLRRDARWAINDIAGISRTTIELI